MKKFYKKYFHAIISISLMYTLTACTSISTFSPYAYEQATSLKVESLILMDKATESFESQKQAVEKLQLKLDKAYEYSNGLPNNEITTKQWKILIDPSRNLLGGFLKMWKEKSTMSQTFIDEAKGLVSDAYDTIIGLESGKIKSSDVK